MTQFIMCFGLDTGDFDHSLCMLGLKKPVCVKNCVKKFTHAGKLAVLIIWKGKYAGYEKQTPKVI